MAIDYAALLGAAAGIQVAKANYDFARDGGGQGALVIDSALIPAGANIVGWVAYTRATLTGGAGFVISIQFDNALYQSIDPVQGKVTVNWLSNAACPPLDRAQTVHVYVGVAAVTAGEVDFWVFYLVA